MLLEKSVEQRQKLQVGCSHFNIHLPAPPCNEQLSDQLVTSSIIILFRLA
jgi:hypothetical protein